MNKVKVKVKTNMNPNNQALLAPMARRILVSNLVLRDMVGLIFYLSLILEITSLVAAVFVKRYLTLMHPNLQ